MLFRITYSSDPNEHYKEDAQDIQFTLTVEADNFKDAEMDADGCLRNYLVFPALFEVVSIQKMDQYEDETPKCECHW